MNLKSNEKICALSSEDVAGKLNNYNVNVGDNPHQQLMQLQRTRRLALWHDHLCILAHGYLLMTIHALYDNAVYMSTDDYRKITDSTCERTVQELVEEPELYIRLK